MKKLTPSQALRHCDASGNLRLEGVEIIGGELAIPGMLNLAHCRLWDTVRCKSLCAHYTDISATVHSSHYTCYASRLVAWDNRSKRRGDLKHGWKVVGHRYIVTLRAASEVIYPAQDICQPHKVRTAYATVMHVYDLQRGKFVSKCVNTAYNARTTYRAERAVEAWVDRCIATQCSTGINYWLPGYPVKPGLLPAADTRLRANYAKLLKEMQREGVRVLPETLDQ